MYKILGSDGHEYGPLSTEKVKQWISENRVEKKTPVLPDGAVDWVFLSSLPEFTASFATQEKSGAAAPGKKRRLAVYMGLILAVVIGVAVILVLKYAKHH